MNNGRFAIALHILVLLDKAKGEVLSSEYLAGSININPAMVRKELISLRKHGFVQTKEGKNGGATLANAANEITLGAIYQSVKQISLLGHQKNTPNPQCPVGKNINTHLDRLYNDTELVLINQLSKQTLADFSSHFN
ncbi:Rrf2 family transcriptional regulator [Pedobacter sp. Hv1]|uniref:Rrf2 family transcriptional regulator n=1 Tax=Pedobacter sp. Hv1 TaxID=1740090 RepID=UPI0006D8D37F|nr:Rrf2 family transcriptional regulator [Pedobacter sp. Hv1]KQC01664.1 Rrf2 family transcriptional regulator [Pedobacter sp. Hv1]